MLNLPSDAYNATGLLDEDRPLVAQMVDQWRAHLLGNRQRNDYYLMHNLPKMLGIAVPSSVSSMLNSSCGWAKKAVDVMVEHSVFDGFSSTDQGIEDQLWDISRANNLGGIYRKAATSALTNGFCAFIVSQGADGKAIITARTASNCTGIWDSSQGRITAGMFVVSLRKDSNGLPTNEPDWIDVLTDNYIIRLTSPVEGRWYAAYEPHGLGRCPMFVAAYEPTLERPFGSSRITREVMGLVDEAVRAFVDESVAAAFAASPQRYLLGTESDPFDEAQELRYKAWIGHIFNVDMAPDGTIPTYGQLPQPSMQPLTDHFRNLCGRMSAATGVHVSQFGLVHDQPASGDAIYMENEPLILKVRDWNADASRTLSQVGTAAAAIEVGATYDDFANLGIDIFANFKNPAMPTLSQMTDSAVKIASVCPWFAQTPTFFSMLGFSDDERRRIDRERQEVAILDVGGEV